jgi:hypothetical protein
MSRSAKMVRMMRYLPIAVFVATLSVGLYLAQGH